MVEKSAPATSRLESKRGWLRRHHATTTLACIKLRSLTKRPYAPASAAPTRRGPGPRGTGVTVRAVVLADTHMRGGGRRVLLTERRPQGPSLQLIGSQGAGDGFELFGFGNTSSDRDEV